jgi:two-component system, OmpR family, response regulator ResD
MASQGDAAANNGGVRRRVLVVDDERTIAEVVAQYLERAGYDTRQAHTGPGAFSSARSWRPDLIVLDVMLPGFDGLEVMRRLRDAGGEGVAVAGPAVILLTARDGEAERIVGLRRGADDYVVKPFSPAELVARVDAVLRRTTRPEETASCGLIEVGDLVIDPACRTAEVDGEDVTLTAREFDLLLHLASNAGRVFSREQLMEAVWNAPFFTDTSTVTVHVRRLRAKIEPDPNTPRYIETARGVGYRFRAAEHVGRRQNRR